jgi:hypothetical protein
MQNPMSTQLVSAGQSELAAGPFSHARYTIKRPFFTFLGREFRVFAPDGSQVLYVRHKVFTWKDKWNIFSDDSCQVPLVSIAARQAIALNITSDVTSAQTGQSVGALQSKGLKSMIKDTWDVLGQGDVPIGVFTEDSNALLRRFIPLLLGKWIMTVNGQEAMQVKQEFRWFAKEFTVELNASLIDPRFGLAAALLALTREIARENQS